MPLSPSLSCLCVHEDVELQTIKIKGPFLHALFWSPSLNFGCELRLLEFTGILQVPGKKICLIILPGDPRHVGGSLIGLNRRNRVWYSWCHQTSCISTGLIANNRNSSGWLKLLRLFLVRMLGCLPCGTQTRETARSWSRGTLFNLLLLLLIGWLHSFPFFDVQHSAVQIGKHDQKQPFQLLEILIYFSLSLFLFSQGRSWLIHLGSDAHFWSSQLWSGLGCGESWQRFHCDQWAVAGRWRVVHMASPTLRPVSSS